MKLFMIDIESTGVDQSKDDIIEIGIVQMLKSGDGFYTPHGGIFHRILGTTKVPESEFAKKHMRALYDKSHREPIIEPYIVRERVIEWLKIHGSLGSENTQFCGWNCSTFDLPFMVKKGYLLPSGYDENDNLIGDFHYRPYEMSGAIELLSGILGYSRKTIISLANEEKNKPEIKIPEGKQHDAVYDCFKQIDLLNGLIALGRKSSIINM